MTTFLKIEVALKRAVFCCCWIFHLVHRQQWSSCLISGGALGVGLCRFCRMVYMVFSTFLVFFNSSIITAWFCWSSLILSSSEHFLLSSTMCFILWGSGCGGLLGGCTLAGRVGYRLFCTSIGCGGGDGCVGWPLVCLSSSRLSLRMDIKIGKSLSVTSMLSCQERLLNWRERAVFITYSADVSVSPKQ